VTSSTDVVSGREENGPEAKDQLTQEPSLGVLEYFHTFERVQVDMKSYFRLKYGHFKLYVIF